MTSLGQTPEQTAIEGYNPFQGINWQELKRAYRVFLQNPSEGILHILAAGKHSNWQKWVENRLAGQGANLRRTSLDFKISELAQLPQGTLGWAYAKHIQEQGFDPEAFVTPGDRDNWLSHRLSLSHDIHHVITGFDGTPSGEFALAVFVLIQYRDLLNVFVLSHLPLFLLKNPSLVPGTMASVLKGFKQGISCRPIFAYSFETNWHKPLEEVRRELNLHS